jgi:hypothetical protein
MCSAMYLPSSPTAEKPWLSIDYPISHINVGHAVEGKLAASRHCSLNIEMPFSWVPKLVIPRDMLDMRVPKGAKKIIYRHSEHELFALFGETSKFDGCIERLSIFQDEAHQIKCEVRYSTKQNCTPRHASPVLCDHWHACTTRYANP